MTEIRVKTNDGRFEISARGHAEGSPAVCAAVSVLFWALARWAREADVRMIEERLEPGDALLAYEGGEAAQTAFDVVVGALAQIARNYPEQARLAPDAAAVQ